MNNDLIVKTRDFLLTLVLDSPELDRSKRIQAMELCSQMPVGRVIDLCDGTTVLLSNKDYAEVQSALLEKYPASYDYRPSPKIEAIKKLRNLTQCGLKQAKDAVCNPSNFEQPAA